MSKLATVREPTKKMYICCIAEYPLLVRIVLDGSLDTGDGAVNVGFFQETHDYDRVRWVETWSNSVGIDCCLSTYF